MQGKQYHKYEKLKAIESKTQSNANTRKLVPRFETPIYVASFTTMKDFTIL